MSTIIKHLLFFALKVMGIKRNFSQDPVDYNKVRKTDKKQPPKYFHRKFKIEERKLEETKLTHIRSKKSNVETNKLILYVPGGAFISGPAQHHWDALNKIIDETDIPVWLVDYPKAPEYNIHQINQTIDHIYAVALKETNAKELILIGDSVGATLIMSLTQRLVNTNKKLPSQLVLITPVFDSSMSNGDIDEIDKVDPMLSKAGILSAKKMCAQQLDLKDPVISPLYGAFQGFPETMLFVGGKDIMSPDGILGSEKMKQSGVPLEFICEQEMPHIYPLLPLMSESREALSSIIAKVGSV